MTGSHDMLHQLLGRSCPGAQLATDDVLKKIISEILKLESMYCLCNKHTARACNEVNACFVSCMTHMHPLRSSQVLASTRSTRKLLLLTGPIGLQSSHVWHYSACSRLIIMILLLTAAQLLALLYR